jgi:hypothetical protein
MPANGNMPTPQPGQLVAPMPMAFNVDARTIDSPTGPVRIVVLRIESTNGSFQFPMPTDFAGSMGQGLMKAATGIEIVRGTPPLGGSPA